MNNDNSPNRLFDFLRRKGYLFKTFSCYHVCEAQNELESFHQQGYFDEKFFQERLASFQFSNFNPDNQFTSVLVIAVPQPMIRIEFRWLKKNYATCIPPTYDFSVNKLIGRQLEKKIKPKGYRIEPYYTPLKYFAVRSGLAEYGRNNVCYIQGLGSFFRLMAFITDIPHLDDTWRNPEMMERCKKCRSCIKACPMGAISEKRFLIFAERCLTFHNENIEPFPKSIAPETHNCLIGCMYCQLACPENKKVSEWIEERECFSENETAMILNDTPLPNLPESTKHKLERLCLSDDYHLLSRNLSVLINKLAR